MSVEPVGLLLTAAHRAVVDSGGRWRRRAAMCAAVVLTGQAFGVHSTTTAACAAASFCARAARALVHVSGFGHLRLRTVFFAIGRAAFLVFAIVLLRHAT